MAQGTDHANHTAYSIQQGGFITIRSLEGPGVIQIDPFELREILYAHTGEEYFEEMDADDS